MLICCCCNNSGACNNSTNRSGLSFDKIEKFVLIQNNTKEISINSEIELQEIKKSLIIMPKENDMPSIKIILKSFEEIC